MFIIAKNIQNMNKWPSVKKKKGKKIILAFFLVTIFRVLGSLLKFLDWQKYTLSNFGHLIFKRKLINELLNFWSKKYKPQMQSENYKQLNFTEASTLKRFEELTINQFRTKKEDKNGVLL